MKLQHRTTSASGFQLTNCAEVQIIHKFKFNVSSICMVIFIVGKLHCFERLSHNCAQASYFYLLSGCTSLFETSFTHTAKSSMYLCVLILLLLIIRLHRLYLQGRI